MSDIRMLDELGAEFARVAASRRRRPRRRVLAAVLTGALVLGAVPATRAGIEDHHHLGHRIARPRPASR